MRNYKRNTTVRHIAIDKYLRVCIINDQTRFYFPRLQQNFITFAINDNLYYYSSSNVKSRQETMYVFISEAMRILTDIDDKKALQYVLENISIIEDDSEIIQSCNFVKALKSHDVSELSKIPKSDLHNHVPYGGNRITVSQMTGKFIPKLDKRFFNIPEMNQWCKENVKTKGDFKARVRAGFLQAKDDGIKVFAPNIAICAKKEFNSLSEFVSFIKELIDEFSDYMKIYPELCLDRQECSEELESLVIKLLNTRLFFSIDLTGDEKLGVKDFQRIYSTADEYGVIKKAHVGEFTNSDYVKDAVNILNLNCIQHGISSIQDEDLMNLLQEKNIFLTMCPSSNFYLSRVKSYAEHPIREFYKKGIKVSICTDDMLIFDSSVSNEYMILYNEKVLDAFELNAIRIDGLEFYD